MCSSAAYGMGQALGPQLCHIRRYPRLEEALVELDITKATESDGKSQWDGVRRSISTDCCKTLRRGQASLIETGETTVLIYYHFEATSPVIFSLLREHGKLGA